MSRLDPFVVAAQHAQAARDDTEWRYRFYVSTGLTVFVTGEIARSTGTNWWAFAALVFFSLAAVRSGKEFFWPKRHWVEAARDREERP